MSVEERAALADCMSKMAAGDAEAFFAFRERWGSRVGGMVKAMVRSMGRADVLADPDELDGLVTDACLVLRDRASGWSRDGALPWTWARPAIWAEVYRFVGHRQVELLEDLAPDEAGPRTDYQVLRSQPHHDLDELAVDNSAVQLVLSAISSTGSERDQKVFLEYRLQAGLGDPSPSNTVAEAMQLSPANVRQISKRFFDKLTSVLEQPQYKDVRSAAIFAT